MKNVFLITTLILSAFCSYLLLKLNKHVYTNEDLSRVYILGCLLSRKPLNYQDIEFCDKNGRIFYATLKTIE